MLMPVIFIGGMKSGMFTPTEAAVVAAFYALVASLFIYGELKVSALPAILAVCGRFGSPTSITRSNVSLSSVKIN